ncbi:MAG TPA: alpha/beta hydrolase [Roseiflexaceae bacterium]|nr:alpha/beta hydrolase [Roseiflexaceae bacterium]
MIAVEHHYAEINGSRMHYVRAGRGERLVLLLHGFPEFWWSWRHQIGPLSEQYTVVAPDLRGYNESAKPNWGYEPDVLVQDIVSLIDTVGFERAVVVGHDWGGALAWLPAIARPWRVEQLVVLNAPHPALFPPRDRINLRQLLRSWYIFWFLIPWLPEQMLRAQNFHSLDITFKPLMRDPARFSEDDLAQFKQAMARPGALTAALNYYRALVLVGLRGMLRGTGMRVTLPTLLIWGEADAYLGTELLDGTDRFVDDLRIHRIANCSHWVQQQRPDLVNRLLLEFLADAATPLEHDRDAGQ